VRRLIESTLHRIWYRHNVAAYALAPVALLYCGVMRIRRGLYRKAVFTRRRFPVPVIVVGNLVAGGTGKTPLVAWLAGQLGAHGYRVGISASGYQGAATNPPRRVTADSNPFAVGDEALLLARRTGCAVCAGADRVRAVEQLLDAGCDLILCDDGLQHERLARDIELALVDAQTGFGNGWCLPAGPLREPLRRLRDLDWLVATRGAYPDAVAMTLSVAGVFPVGGDGPPRPLAAFAGTAVHAVAGIARPERFFTLLGDAGLQVSRHPFADHHRFRPRDLNFRDGKPVLMTEKDAVKCRTFAPPDTWFVRVDAQMPPEFMPRLLSRLAEWQTSP